MERRLARLESRVDEVVRALDELRPVIADLQRLLDREVGTLRADVRRAASMVDSLSAALDADVGAITRGLERLREEQAGLARRIEAPSASPPRRWWSRRV